MVKITTNDVHVKDADCNLAVHIADLVHGMRSELAGIRTELSAVREELQTLRGERSETAMLSVCEAAAIAGVSERTLRTKIKAGRVPSARIGRRLLVPRQAFIAWLDRRIQEGRGDR